MGKRQTEKLLGTNDRKNPKVLIEKWGSRGSAESSQLGQGDHREDSKITLRPELKAQNPRSSDGKEGGISAHVEEELPSGYFNPFGCFPLAGARRADFAYCEFCAAVPRVGAGDQAAPPGGGDRTAPAPRAETGTTTSQRLRLKTAPPGGETGNSASQRRDRGTTWRTRYKAAEGRQKGRAGS